MHAGTYLLKLEIDDVIFHEWGQAYPGIPRHILKVTKFLVKISQFEFLGMTVKNIFVYNLFFFIKV